MKEFELIKIIKTLVDDNLNIIGDDTAIIKESGTVLTCDTLVENTHFRLDTTSAFDLGYKSAAVNLSDVAASGGTCDYFLVSLAIPKNIDVQFIKDFYSGMKNLADQFNTAIVGGDLTFCETIVVTVTAIGKTSILSGRSNAEVGQKIITTGNYGASYIGLKLLESRRLGSCTIDTDENPEIIKRAITRHLKPFPRINEAQFFIKNFNYNNYCMMDSSDGLADALFQIAQKSNKRLNIYLNKIPIDKELLNLIKLMKLNPYDVALYGGEDFELLIACAKKDIGNILNNTIYPFSEIGEIVEGNAGVNLIYNDTIIELDEQLLEQKISYKHF